LHFAILNPLKPVLKLNKMTPRLNISAFSPSYGIPFKTSGAAYALVPTFPV